MVKRIADWTPIMEQRADLEGRQVKCLIASGGHLWMQGYFDQFPSVGSTEFRGTSQPKIRPPHRLRAFNRTGET